MPIYLFSAPGRGIELASPRLIVPEEIMPLLRSAHLCGNMALYFCNVGIYNITPKYSGAKARTNDYYVAVYETGERAALYTVPRDAGRGVTKWNEAALEGLKTNVVEVPWDTTTTSITANVRGSDVNRVLVQAVLLYTPAHFTDAQTATPIGQPESTG